MKLLIVAATSFELEPLTARLTLVEKRSGNLSSYSHGKHLVDVLITGVGIASTAAHCASLNLTNYDLLINAGVCGSFNNSPAIGEVILVTDDFFSEMGAEDGEEFIPFPQMNLQGDYAFTSSFIPQNLDHLPRVQGCTVQTVHGNNSSIETFIQRFPHVQIESMEGAAFMLACQLQGAKAVQIRAVSNRVEKRDRSKWNFPLAIQNLNMVLFEFLNKLA